ncbi:LysR substrate-binding domain-containing protein [Sodalis sp. RH16]|uniref:LysR substrate-binding domain-containing protein n=1 Tax=Sodalis sp. RH16 TaxID=3394331 RepID=UPI0039B3D9A1
MTTIMEKTTGLVAFVRTVQNGSFASAGMGIIQIPRFAVADDIAAGTLIHVLPVFPMLVSPIHALHPFGRQLPIRARLFVDFLVEQFREKDTAS